MTTEEKRQAIRENCENRGGDCNTCPLISRNHCYTKADKNEIEENYALLFGESDTEKGDSVMKKQTITISLKRYEELILKEALYDKITDGKKIETYLISRKENKGGA